jgi:hypothetical protein
MKIPIKIASTLAAVGLLAGTPVFAGSFTTDFSSPTGYTLAGTGTNPGGYVTNLVGDPVPFRAVLAPAVAGNSGSVTLDDLDGGQPIESFVATFKLQLGPGSGNAADGVSFNFGPNIAPTDVYSEEGPGGTALTVSFDIYVNADVGEVSPTVKLKYGGVVFASYPYAKADMVTSQLEDVIVQLTKAGKVSVTYKGVLIHDNVLVPGWAPTFGLFNFSARSGGEYCEQEVASVSITTVLQGAAVAPTIVTPPASVTVNEHDSNTFTVAVDGTAPFTFQWTDNNVDIANETGVTYRMVNIPYTENNHQIRVRVSNPANVNGILSAPAVLTVVRDTTPPTVVKANANSAGDAVTVVFSEPMNDTVLDPVNFGINQGVVISYITRSSDTTVVLHPTTPLLGGQEYVLSVHDVYDMASTPNKIVSTQVTFRSSLFQIGSVLHKKYANLNDNQGNLASLQNDPRYPNNPDRQDIMTAVEYPANGGYRDTVADPRNDPPPLDQQFSDTLECIWTVPETNDYVFFTTGADISDVYLSTDTDPANMVNIAQCSGWTNPRDWMVSQCGTTNGLRSDWYTGNNSYPGVGDPGVGAALIHLDGGSKHYLFAFHHRFTWSGADDFAVTYLINPGANQPAAGAAPVMTGDQVGAYLDPTGASVSFAQQPADAIILQGRKATFTAVATGQSLYGTNVVLQWQTAPAGSGIFTNLVGETKASYTTPALVVADTGRQYKVLATVPGFTVPSSIATVTVNADTIAPKIVSVAALPSRTGNTFDVGVTFDEPLEPGSAGTQGNYAISAGTITGIKFYPTSPGVVLTVSGLTAGTAYSVTVINVADPYGNHITSANLPGTYSSMHWDIVGANEAQLGNGVVAVGPNAFDIYSDGVTEWAAYDEATFVYEQVTGDFDKELRVEYVDPASQWARAGIIVRDVPNFGVDRATQEGGLAGRYQKVHVQPVTTAMGTPGANDYESNRRLDTGGATDGPQLVGHTPAYPNAWCRLQRVGQTFNKFASDDGVNWINLGTTTWGVDDVSKTPMPDTLYVGPEYSPENGNVSEGFKAMFGIKVRDYRNHGAVAPPSLSVTRNANGTFTLTYTGTLVSSDTVKGTYTPVSGASSPWPVDPKASGAKATQFYRAQQ